MQMAQLIGTPVIPHLTRLPGFQEYNVSGLVSVLVWWGGILTVMYIYRSIRLRRWLTDTLDKTVAYLR